MKRLIPFTIVTLTLVFVCCFCGKNTTDEIKILKLHCSGEQALKTSSFADTIIYIPLETTGRSLIDGIESIWMNDSVILVQENSRLLLFSINGEFIKQIGTNGRGPGEYERISNFKVANDTIYLYASSQHPYLRYTLDGIFCDEVILNIQTRYFSVTADQKLVIYNRYEGEIYVYNNGINMPPDTIVVEYGVSELRHYRSGGGEGPWTNFQETSSGLLFTNYVNDTIWNISGNKKEPAYILDTKDKLLPWDKQIEYYTMDETPRWMAMAKSYHFFNLVPVASSMFIFQNVWFDDDYKNLDNYFYQTVYHSYIKTGEFKKYDYIYDDIAGNQKLTWFYHIYSEDYLVGEILPYNLLKHLSQNKEDPPAAWQNQMKNIKADDNPILVRIKVRNK